MPPLLLHVSALLTAVFVAGFWQGLALAAMGLALCSWMSRASAGLRHTILVVLFTGVLVLPWLHLRRPASAVQSHGLQLAPWVAAAIALLWVSAVILRAVQLFLAWHHLCKARRNATPVQVLGADTFCGGRRRAVLCSSPDVDSPSMLGLGSPRLLLPNWMVPDLSETELRQIALHECEHLRRGDDWLNLLLQVGMTLFPLNPALLWLNRGICVQRELAADAAVVAQTAQPLTYATCLTRLAEQRRQRGRLRLALAAWGRQSELVLRVHVLLGRSSGWTRSQSAWATGAAATALLLAATGMACAPQLVHIGRNATQLRSAMEPVADPQLATVVPIRSMGGTLRGHDRTASPVRMVSASFHVPSGPLAAARAKRRRSRASTNSPTLKAALSQRGSTPRILRTAAVTPQYAFGGQDRSAQTYELPVRLVTAEFSSPYVAVPVRNGWLLIEL